ncbi:chromosome partitioning protein ParA [Nostoc sp. T09]|uniref:AAA family ATPase n=1 Tax=Nostoc sp. T09 TaxID=1932621 RepID=UPI000A364401|nr:AAA family ATPase [Nostoc sp. T09]OUL35828.1 chromosome partitioning protein ParA [Nostoc sp. T09]
MPFNPELCRNESEVESKLIVQYLLPQLGYTPDTWHQEVILGSIRLDFLAFAAQVVPFVLDANSPLSVVMEAKHPKHNLNNHVLRLRHYLTSLNVRYGLLTNGKEIRIYEKSQYDIELVFQCAGKDIETNLETIINLIGRESLKERHLINNSANQISDNSFPSAQSNVGYSQVNLKPELPIIKPQVIQVDSQVISEIKRQDTMKTIAIYHHKGGVGKTTVAINLAAAFSKKGKRVLLIDIDAQANTTFATGLIKFQFEEDDDLKDCNVSHLLEKTDFNFIPDIVRKSKFFNDPEVDIIPSHITLIAKQNNLVQYGASRNRLAKKLEKVKNEYDIVIIDTPPSLDLYAQAALTAADYLIIPSDLKPFSNQGLPSVQSFIKQEINENKEGLGKPPLIIMGVLPSKISTNAQYLKYTFAKHKSVITDRYNMPIMDSIISERTALSACVNRTISVGNMEIPDPKSILDFAINEPSANQAAAEFEFLAIEVLRKMEMK